MKFIKKFEKYRSSTKNKFKYLNADDEEILENFLIKYIHNKNILVEAKEIDFKTINRYSFNYEYIFNDMLVNFKITYVPGSVYYDADKFINSSNITNEDTPSIRNSIEKIIKKYWIKIEPQFSKIIDDTIIKYFNKNTYHYEHYLKFENLSDNVKKNCNWIIDSKKYNL